MRAVVRWLCLLALLVLPGGGAEAVDRDSQATRGLVQAEAVRGAWDQQQPPEEGWEPVRLMDVWTARWPEHDGVVW